MKKNMKLQWLIRNFFRMALPMLCLVIVLGVFSLIVMQKELNTVIREKNMQILQQANQAVENIFSTIELIGANLDTNAKNQQLLKSVLNKRHMAFSKEDIDTISFFTDMLRSHQHANPYIHSILLYVKNQDENILSSNYSVTNRAWVKETAWLESYELMPEGESHLFTSRNLQEYPYKSGSVTCITLSRAILHTSYPKGKAGIIVVNFRANMINAMIEDTLTAPDSAIFVLTPDGKVIAGASRIEGLDAENLNAGDIPDSEVSEWSFNGKQFFCLTDVSRTYGLKMISITPADTFYQSSKEILSVTILILIFSLIIGSAVSYYVAHKNYSNMSAILSAIQAAENNEPLSIELKTPKNEYEYLLGNMVNVFIQKSVERTRSIESKYTLRTMELAMLQEQMNPHFLFNTLRTIFWKTVALTAHPNEASKMIEYLTDILSFVLTTPGYRVAMKQEIAYADSYLNIQRIRYNNKFTVMWQYDKKLDDIMIMKMLLQPLLENSIMHGIANGEKSDYKIYVSVKESDRNIHVRVADNGEGMPGETLRAVRDELEKGTDSGSHIGLKNVKKRLEVLYKAKNIKFEINSRLHRGTLVHIVFPACLAANLTGKNCAGTPEGSGQTRP